MKCGTECGRIGRMAEQHERYVKFLSIRPVAIKSDQIDRHILELIKPIRSFQLIRFIPALFCTLYLGGGSIRNLCTPEESEEESQSSFLGGKILVNQPPVHVFLLLIRFPVLDHVVLYFVFQAIFYSR